ncbi:MAG: MarR family transcriptional regulator [Myxococcales bacterium]|jgi:DNA-binding MarR family transcriptional regulator|nr:MarR family transcriptional regulator [Myxococcales bacterium]
MHVLNFSIKRAHHRIVRFTRGILHPFAITPARFDMLQAIDRQVDAPTQSEIARSLGVTRQTVSEMLDALESLGLVERVDDEVDRRRTLIVLTRAARTLLRRAYAILVRSGVANVAAARALVDLPRAPAKVAALLDLTTALRRTLRDFARFVPPRVDVDEHDLDRSLDEADRAIYRRVVRYCQSWFNHLPAQYLLLT